MYRPGIVSYVDGNCLDTQIPGFSTLTIEGRESIGRNIETVNYKTVTAGGKKYSAREFDTSQSLNRLISSSYMSRVVRIHFKIVADNDHDCRRKWEEINYYTNKEETTLRFSDDPDYYYIGTLIGVGEIPGNVNSAISYLEYECLDPFKYERTLQSFKFTMLGTFDRWSMYEVKVESIETNLTSSAQRLGLQNVTSGAYINIDRSFSSGDKVIFDLLNHKVLMGTGQDITADMDFTSYLEDFTLSTRDNLRCTSRGVTEINYRRKVL